MSRVQLQTQQDRTLDKDTEDLGTQQATQQACLQHPTQQQDTFNWTYTVPWRRTDAGAENTFVNLKRSNLYKVLEIKIEKVWEIYPFV